ncbi:gliding motility-associated C-terminal domain-containing protein [Chitinophaga sp. RAB17]|uniref:Ig-like domain-containing protein n=1 Tax=Chitinophaga sp. RAB17 TaxID=3233049 RepID=UPI003F924885
MHSKATPNSPFTALFCLPHPKGTATVKTSLAYTCRGAGSLAWKSLLVLLLLFGISAKESSAQTYTTRVYANDQASRSTGLCVGCNVANPGQAVDGNLNTASTINTLVTLLGATESQDLIFPAPVTNNAPAIVKVGSAGNLGGLVSLQLLGGVYVQAYNGSTPVGDTAFASEATLTLLASGNQAEIFLVAPGVTYDRVRVTVDGGLAGVAGSINVFSAYYNVPAASTIACDVAVDVLSGVTGSIGALGSVTNPVQAGDGIVTPANFATLSSAVGLLNSSAQVTAIYPGLSKLGDSVRIVMSIPSSLITLQVLGSVKIITYNGPTVVDNITASSNFLNLTLLGDGSGLQSLSFQASAPFDRVEVLLGSVLAGALSTLRVHEIQRYPAGPATNSGALRTTCLNSAITLNVTSPDPGLTYTWYDSTQTTVVASNSTSYSPPVNAIGTFRYYVSAKRLNCSTESAKTLVTVKVNNFATAADITVPANTASCPGDTARITPTSVTANTKPVFKWYKDAAKTTAITNGLVEGAVKYTIDTTGRLSITGLAVGTYNYFVSVTDSNHCENAANTLKQATVTVGTGPAPASVAPAFSVPTGQTVTLTAAPVPGATIVWYSDTTQASIGAGTSFQVGPFSTPGTYTFYAGVRLTGGCESYRVPVVVTVTGPVTTGGCNVPTSQVTGTTLGCVLCSVDNPTNDIDVNPNNFTQLNLPVGLLGGSVYQQLIFPAVGAATDSIRIDLGTSAPLANVSLLGGTIITIANGTTVIRRDTLSQLLTLRLLSSTRYSVSIPATGPYDRVQILMTGTLNLLNALQIYGVRAVGANPTITPNGFTTCVGSTATLSVTPAAGTSVLWFADSTTTTSLSNQPTYTTTVLNTPGKVTYFVQVVDGSGASACNNPERIPVVVNVNPLGTAADITLPDTTATCGSAAAVITPTAAGVTAPVFKWYANANKTTPIINGTVIGAATFAIDSTGKLSVTGLAPGNYTYYASVSGTNRCENAAGSLKAATIKVTSTPAPPTLIQTYTVTTGLPLTLVASPAPGATVLWYSDTTKASIGSGSSITLPPFSTPGVYKYFAGDSLPGGCISNRLLVTITVTGPVIPTSCNVPTSQVTGTTLGCVLCSVVNPTNDIDADLTNFARLNIPVGLLGGSVFQQLIFPANGAGTDSIRFDLASPGGLADVSLLGGAVITVYNNNTVVSTHTLSQLLTLRLLSGNRYTASVAAGGAYNKVEVKLTGVANLLNSLDIYNVRAVGPNPTITASNVTVCAGQPAALTATPAAGTTVQWYKDSTGGASLSNQPTYTTDSLKTAGTFTYYVQVVDGTCPNPERIPVTVTVNPLGSPADITVADTTTVCGSATAVLTPTAAGVTTPVFKWYANANKTSPIINGTVIGGATFTIDASGILRVTGLTPGNHTYYVSVSGTNRCENAAGSLKAATIKVTSAPAPPTLVQTYTVTTGLPLTLVASPAPGATVVWYSDTTLASIGSGSSITLPPFSTPGVYKYFAGDSLPGGCISNRLLITVTVTGPVIPTSCNVPTSQVTGTTLGCVLCSVVNPTNDIDADLTNFARLNIPVGLLGGSVFQQLIFPTNGAGTDSIRFDLASPGGLADVSLLGGAVITVYNNNTVVSTHTLSQLLTLRLLSGSRYTATVAAGGAYNKVEVKLTGVANLLNSLDIYNVRAVGPNPTITANSVTVCVGQPAALTATPAAGTTVQWYKDSTGGASLSNQPTYTTDSLKTAGTFTYYVQVVDGTCPNPERIPVTVTVNPLGSPADITVTDTTATCGGSAAVLIPTAAGVTTPVFTWYANANKTSPIVNGTVIGGATFTIDAAGKLTVTGLTQGSHTYYVSVSGANRCENAAGNLKPATINVTGAPAPPTVVQNYTITTGLPLTLVASPAPGATVVWYSDTTKAAIATGNSITLPPFTNPGVYIYYAGDSLAGGCLSSRLPITITVTGPVIPTSCNVPTSQVTGTTLGCVLCSVVNPTNDIDSVNTNFTRLNIPVGLLGGSVFQQLIFPTNGSGADSIRFDLASPGGLADVSLLGGAVITVYNNNTVVSTHTLSQLLTLRLLSGTRYTATVAAGGAFNKVEVKLTGVANLLNSLDIYNVRSVVPDPTIAAKSVTVCAGQPAVLTATPSAGTTVRWYADSTSPAILSTLSTFTTDSLKTAGTFVYYAQAVSASGCANPNRIPVTVIVNPLSNAGNITIADTTTACTSNPAVLTPTATGVTAPVFKWYKDANKTSPITNGLVNGAVSYALDSTGKLTITGLTAGNYTYYVSVSGTGQCENPAGALKAAKVQVVTAPAAPVVTGDVVVQTGVKATLSATPVIGGNATIVWYSDSTSTVPVGTGASIQVGPFNNPGTYTYYAAIQITGACSSARVPVHVVVTGPVIPSPDCNVPTSQNSGTTLGCILCSVNGPTNDIDSVQTNFTRLSIPVGLLGGSVYQQLIFPNPGKATDSIQIRLATSVGLADVSLLGGTLISLYNNNTLVKADTLSRLLTLRLLNGQQFAATITAPGAYDRIEVRLTGVLNLLNSIDIYGARIFYPKPTVNTTGASVCINNKATLSVTPAAGTSVRWYADSTSTTVLSTQSTYTTDTLRTAGKITYYVAVLGGPNNCPNPERIPVSVTVSPAPAVPGAPATVNICPGSDAVLQVTNPDHQLRYNWYNVATGGTKLNTDSGFVFSVPAVSRDTIFYVEAVSSCGAASARQAISVKLSTSLSAPTVIPNPDSVVIGTQGVLTATSNAANVIFKWYGSQTGNDSLFTGPVFTPPISNTLGTVTYWVEAALTGGTTCKSIRVPAVVVTIPAGPFTQVPCEGATTQTIGGSGLLILGNVYNPALSVDNDASTASSLVINLGALNAQVWQRAKFNGVSSLGDTVRVLLSNPSQVLSAAVLGGVQLTTYNGNTPGDSVAINNPLVKLTLLNNSKQAIVEFVPTKAFDAIEVKLKSGIVGALTTIDFNYAQRALVAPKVQAAQVTVCAGNTATLNVQDPVAGITYRWYNSNGIYLTGKDGVSLTTGTLTKDTTFFVEAFRNGCASKGRARVDVKVTAAPAAPQVQSANVDVCAGSDAVLAVVNPVKGYTYAWYNVAAGGTKLNTDSGFTYKVVNVTAKAIYYVEAKNDSCNTVSATRTAVTVNTAAALAPPTVSPTTDTVVVGQQPVFRASAASANAQFFWFASQTSTDTLFKGSTFAPPASNVVGTITYWVEAALPGAATCKSARVAVNALTVNSNLDIVPCEGATGQTIGGSGLLILGNVYNPALAVDNNKNTAASLVINLGAVNASVFEKATFTGLSTPGDTVRVMLSNPGQVLSAAVLASIQLTTYNGNTAGDSVLVSNPILHLDLLSGSRGALLSFVPTKAFDAVEVKLKSGIIGALTAIDFNYAQRAIVQPKVQSNNATICKGKQATLSVVNPAQGVVYSWYNSQGNRLLDSIAFVTPTTLDSGTYTYFVRATRNGCTGSASAPVLVVVKGIPSVPVPVSNNVSTCLNTPVTLSVKAVAGVQFNWYDAATGGAILVSNNNTYTTPANLQAGTYNFYVEAVNAGNCANDSGRVKIMLTVDSASTAADIQVADKAICAGGVAVLTPTSTTVQNPVFKWYANPDKTGPITQGVSAAGVLTISGLATGTYTYYVSVSNAGKCENPAGALKAVKVTVNAGATAADIILADTTICANSTVKLTATSTTVINPIFKWYKDASLTTLLFTGPTYTTALITANTSFYVTVEGDNRCANTAANAKTVTVTVRDVPVPIIAASAISICVGDTTTLTVQNADNTLTYRWYNAATGGTLLFTGPVYVVRGLTASADFYAEASAGACSSATRTKVSIGVGVAPTPILESNNVTVCQGGTAVLKVTSSVNNITYKWYNTATGGAAIFTGPIYTTGAINANVTFYVEAIGDTSKCGKPSARAAAKVNVVPVPAAPTLVSNNVQGCIGQSASLAIQSPAAGTTYQWFNAATGGTMVFEGPVFNITALDSTVTYYVQALVNGGCPSATRSSATIKVNSIPTAPVVTATSLFVCQGGSVTLSIKDPVAGTTYRWFDAATAGNLLFTGVSFPTGVLNVSTDFYAEASNGNCSSALRTKVSIGVGQAPTPILESNAVTACQGTTATLRVTSATNGITYKWYTQATGGTAVFTGPIFTTDPLNTSMDFWVEATGTTGQCGNPSVRVKATVTVVVAPNAPDVVASSLKTCAGTGVTVAVKTILPNVTYQWYDAATNGSLLFTGAVYSVPVITKNTTYYVQANLGSGCSSSTRTAVNVTVDPAPPIPTVDLDNVVTCIGGTATFTIKNPDATMTYRWFDAPSNGTLLATGTAYTTAALAQTTVFYLEALNSAGCSSARKGLTATVVSTIDAPLADPITICSGQTGVLSAKNKQPGVIYKWYTVLHGGSPVFTGGDFTIRPTANAVYYLEASTSGGCVSASRTQVNVSVNPSPSAPAVANATLQACPGQTVTLNALNPDAALTYKWYTTAVGGTAVATGASYTTPPVNANQMYYLEATNSNGCSSPTRTAVSVEATPAPGKPTITGNDAGVCPGKTATLTAASTTTGVDFRWYTVATGGTPIFTGATFVTPALNTATTYYVEAFTTGGCISAGQRTTVQVAIAQPLPAPVVTVDNTTATTITFRWSPVTGAQRYEVTLNNGVTFIPPSSGANGTTHTITGLQPNQSATIQVRAIGASDCETSALSTAVTGKTTNPQGNNIYVPNLFSPNGDGINDIEYVYSTAIAQLEFRIYNQWGQLVFTSKDQRQGWDGTMSGQKQPVGVYVYIVRATMQDGTVITKKGNVTIMR